LKEGLGDLEKKPPMLLVMNKKDLIKPGEIAKKLEVSMLSLLSLNLGNTVLLLKSHHSRMNLQWWKMLHYKLEIKIWSHGIAMFFA